VLTGFEIIDFEFSIFGKFNYNYVNLQISKYSRLMYTYTRLKSYSVGGLEL